MTKKRLLIAIFALAITLLLSGCGGEKEKGSIDDILIYGKAGDAVGLDPGRETDGESFIITGEIFEGLVGFTPGTTDVMPALAESWSFSDDGLSLTFILKKGVKFHDGTDFNADAVVFNFERQSDKNNEYYEYGPWKYWGYMGFDDLIKAVVKVDDYTVRIDLLKQDVSLLATLAMDFMGIPSPTAVKKYKADFTNNPVGTGPFKFVSWTKGDSIILEANKDYRDGAAQIDKVIYKVIPEPTSRALALENGEIDIFLYPSPDDLPRLRGNKNIQFYEQSGLNISYLAFNVQRKPFDDVRVREALNYAIDKNAIIKAAYGELGEPLAAPLPPIIWAFDKNIKSYPYNPEKAKELLAEAGYADGFTAEMLALPVSRPYMPQGKKVAEIIQQQFAEIGVTAEIQVLEWGAHLERTDQGKFDMGFLGWQGDNGDPDNFLRVLLAADQAEVPASNIAFWKNKEFTDIVKQAITISDVQKRKELYIQAQDIFANEVPWATIANSKTIIPMNKKVKGFVYTPTGKSNLYSVYIEK